MTRLIELYREIKIKLYGFYDDCDEEHHHVLREMEKIMNADKIDPMQPGADPQPIVPTLDNPPLCCDCKWAVRGLGTWTYATCTHPALPVNLVSGRRVFPCVITRGYEELCGRSGVRFRPR